MQTTNIEVDILYYTEEDDLVMNCPQLDIIGLVKFDTPQKELQLDFILKSFDIKLQERIDRFPNKGEYLDTLVKNGNCFIDQEQKIAPQDLQYFIDKYDYLQDTIDIPNAKSIKHTFQING